MNIIVASTNPVKIQAAQQGFQQMFPKRTFTAKGVSVASGVSDQPMTDEETLRGAVNRAINARKAQSDADYWVGIEGGCEEKHDQLWTYAWVVIMGVDSQPRLSASEGVLGLGVNLRVGKARTGAFMLPQEVALLVRSGVELGVADDQIFERSDSKRNNGAVGLLTDDLIDRQRYYEHAVVLALIPFKNMALRWG